MKKFLTLSLLICLTIISSGYKKPDVYVVDAEKNAFVHNNMGIIYASDKNYAAAIEEFRIAISLNPKAQSTAVYYNNLGETYMKVGLYNAANACFTNAITQFNLNFMYYQNLAKCYKSQKLLDNKIKYYATNKDPFSMIMLGLLYAEKGDIKKAVIKLDEFCTQEPDLIITGAVRNYIKTLISKN